MNGITFFHPHCFSFYTLLFMLQLVLAMAERRRKSVAREILNAEDLDEITGTSNAKPSLCERVKKSVKIR